MLLPGVPLYCAGPAVGQQNRGAALAGVANPRVAANMVANVATVMIFLPYLIRCGPFSQGQLVPPSLGAAAGPNLDGNWTDVGPAGIIRGVSDRSGILATDCGGR